jgi:hypothetical protein
MEEGKLRYRGEAAMDDVAYQYALETREEFSSALNRIQGFQEGSSAAGLGVGVGTGAAVAFGGSTTLLKGLALGAGQPAWSSRARQLRGERTDLSARHRGHRLRDRSDLCGQARR